MFMVDSVAYLGHIVDAQGLHLDSEKVRAIEQPPPASLCLRAEALPGASCPLQQVFARPHMSTRPFVRSTLP